MKSASLLLSKVTTLRCYWHILVLRARNYTFRQHPVATTRPVDNTFSTGLIVNDASGGRNSYCNAIPLNLPAYGVVVTDNTATQNAYDVNVSVEFDIDFAANSFIDIFVGPTNAPQRIKRITTIGAGALSSNVRLPVPIPVPAGWFWKVFKRGGTANYNTASIIPMRCSWEKQFSGWGRKEGRPRTIWHAILVDRILSGASPAIDRGSRRKQK